jgi:hypothetical protein
LQKLLIVHKEFWIDHPKLHGVSFGKGYISKNNEEVLEEKFRNRAKKTLIVHA